MTHPQAIAVARDEAHRSGIKQVVYRLPGWPVDCYGVRAIDQLLPMAAQTFECLPPSEAPTSVETPAEAQGRLFTEDA